jgi:hypothetical protein
MNMAGAGVFPKSIGDLISAADYNAVQTLIAGTKSGYYGVATSSGQVAANNQITAADWNLLKSDIDSCTTHQTGSDSIITTKNSTTVVTTSDINSYYTNAGNASANAASVYAATQLALVAGVSSNNGGGWNSSINHIVQIDFASAADATYFFQCGAYLAVSASYTGSGGGPKDSSWRDTINAIGSKQYNLANWNAGGTVVIATVSGTGVYTQNYWRLTATKASSTRVILTMLFADSRTENIDETVSLSITSSVDYYKSIGGITSPLPSAIATTDAL